MRFSVNIDSIFRGQDIYGPMEKLAKAGVKDFEFWFWMDKDEEKLLSLKEQYGLRYVGYVPYLTSMVDPKEKEGYLGHLQACVDAARRIGCTGIFIKPGDTVDGLSYETQRANMKEILEEAVKMVENDDMVMLLEPVSFQEAPKTFLGTSDLAFELVAEIDSPKLKVLYDLYHMAMDEGDVIRHITSNLPLIGHLHCAGITSRHELEDGEINYEYVFRKLDEAGYEGLCGLEYFPTRDPFVYIPQVLFENKYL